MPVLNCSRMAILLTVFRRLLLIPSALFAGVLGLASFNYTGDFFFSLCSPEWLEFVGSGSYREEYVCVTPWYPWAKTFTLVVSAAVASSLFVLLPALLEPKEHYLAAVIAYTAGATLTIIMLFFLPLPGFFFTVLTAVAVMLSAGLGCVWVVKRQFGTGGGVTSPLPHRLPQSRRFSREKTQKPRFRGRSSGGLFTNLSLSRPFSPAVNTISAEGPNGPVLKLKGVPNSTVRSTVVIKSRSGQLNLRCR